MQKQHRLKNYGELFRCIKRRYCGVAVLLSIIIILIVDFWSSLFVGNCKIIQIRYSSPIDIAMSEIDAKLYVAENTAKSIAIIDCNSLQIENRIALSMAPTGLFVSEYNHEIYVTCGGKNGKVLIYDIGNLSCKREVNVGHTPCSPVLSHDFKMLYVCNRFDGDVSIIDLTTGTSVARVMVSREPVASVINNDGTFLFVAGLLPDPVNSPQYASSVVSVIDLKVNRVIEIIPFPKGATSLKGLCFSGDGKYLYATHLIGRYKVPTMRVSGGWINTNAVSIIDSGSFKPITSVLLDDPDTGAANPCSIVNVKINDTALIAISLSGTNEVMIIDEQGMISRMSNALSSGMSDEEIVNDLTFLSGLKHRIALQDSCPKEMCVRNEKLYVCNYYGDSVTEVHLASGELKYISMSEKGIPSDARRGEMLFNSAEICFQQWQSCASCHPDGRTDSLSWDLLNDGIGNPKDTKSLLLSHKTPPVMALGVRVNAQTAVRSGMKYILMSEMDENNAKAIDEYLKSMQPEVSPWNNPENAEKIIQGEKIFNQLGCVNCHSSELYTDLESHNVKTGKNNEKDKEFDTPTLVETWRTLPYFNDGSQSNVGSVIKYHLDNGLLENNQENIDKDDLEPLELYIKSR